MSIELKSYRTEHGNKTVLVDDSGRKYLHVLVIDSPVTVQKVALSEAQYMQPVIENSHNHRGIKSIARQYRSIGRKLGITKKAKAFLRKYAAA